MWKNILKIFFTLNILTITAAVHTGQVITSVLDDRWWWLSGSDTDSEGDFYWYKNGERISYADWSAGQPDNYGGHENCVHLWYIKPKYQMNDWVCHEKAYYVCEADKPKTIVLSVF
ncbi:C-type lectin 37Da [Lucilia cuprina]|nr:C-type lectin 37Da [Lucilia cuprina]